MASGWFKSTKTKVAILGDVTRVTSDMAEGDCSDELETAMKQCDRDWDQRSGFTDRVVRKPGEVFPVSVESCAKATAALRKCMECKDVLAKHMDAMDKGLEEDERRRRRDPGDAAVELDATKWRWWTGMMKTQQEFKAS